MKKSFYFFGLATIVAAAFTFTGCSSDDPENEVKKPEEEKAISFTTTITNNARTRATSELQTTSIANGVQVGIFATGTGGDVTNGTNALYTSDGNSSLTAGGASITCPSTVTSIDFKAYAPYNSEWTSASTQQTFTVQTNQSTDANYLASDLLYGTGTLSTFTDNAQAALTFNHKLSRIKIVLEAAAGSSVDLSNATVTIKNTLPSIAFTPGDGTVGAASGNTTDITAGTGATTYAIVVPQTVTSGTELISIDINGDGSKVLTAKLGANQTFVSGETYAFTVTVGDFAAAATTRTLGTPTTSFESDWSDGIPSSITPDKLWATFGTPSSSAKYEENTYKWWASSNNLMKCFNLTAGDLGSDNDKYKKLHYTVSNLTGTTAQIRFHFKGNGVDKTISVNANDNVLDLTTCDEAVSNNLSDINEVFFGGTGSTKWTTNEGQSDATTENPFTVTIKASDVYLSKD